MLPGNDVRLPPNWYIPIVSNVDGSIAITMPLMLLIREQLSLMITSGRSIVAQHANGSVDTVRFAGHEMLGPWSSSTLMICVCVVDVPAHQSTADHVRRILYVPSQTVIFASVYVHPIEQPSGEPNTYG